MNPFKVVRTLVLALIMFFALKLLGFSSALAGLGALIPLLFGCIDLMAATVFSLTGCVFIFAVAVTLFPTQYMMLKKLVGVGIMQASTRAQISGSNASTNGAGDDKK